MATDIFVVSSGSLVVMYPGSDAGREWCREHLPEDCPRWATGYVVEHRYAGDVIDGMHDDGLVIA